jgi:hypothetical protein
MGCENMNLFDKVIGEAKKERMEKASQDLKAMLVNTLAGEVMECPFCFYHTTKNKFSAKVREENGVKSFNCWHCGKWARC